jgi:hypothetical protein
MSGISRCLAARKTPPCGQAPISCPDYRHGSTSRLDVHNYALQGRTILIKCRFSTLCKPNISLAALFVGQISIRHFAHATCPREATESENRTASRTRGMCRIRANTTDPWTMAMAMDRGSAGRQSRLTIAAPEAGSGLHSDKYGTGNRCLDSLAALQRKHHEHHVRGAKTLKRKYAAVRKIDHKCCAAQ